MNSGIMVKGSTPGLLSVSLKDILSCVEEPKDITWVILWFTATGKLKLELTADAESMIDFENKINQSENGLEVNWRSLESIANQVDQVIEFLLIGSDDSASLIRYKDDDTMHSTCEYSLELVDSSYWILYSKNLKFLTNVRNNLSGVVDLY